jgi:uncharacterized protein (TIGR02246 family)
MTLSKKIVFMALAAAATVAGCGNPSATAVKQEQRPSQQEIAALFDEWNTALSTLDPQKVADRYAPNAVLLPTVSNEVRADRARIVDYFQHFLENHPKGEVLKSHVAVLDEDDAIDAGTYRFTLTKDGVTRTVDARYTFVYEKIDGKWLIVNHHSSAMPESS